MLDSMHRHAVSTDATLSAPDQPSVHAGYVIVGDVIKRLVRKLHGLLKHQLMVHGSIVREGGAGFHSYFPVVLIAISSIFLSSGGYPQASAKFVRDA